MYLSAVRNIRKFIDGAKEGKYLNTGGDMPTMMVNFLPIINTNRFKIIAGFFNFPRLIN